MLTPRRSWSAVLLPLVLGACSTALLVDTPYDDDPQPDADVLPDGGLPHDGSVPSDASTPRDATTPRDSGSSDAGAARDSGSSDAGTPRDAGLDPGFPRNCATELPDDNIASLLTDDCASRPLLMCGNQSNLDNQLSTLVRACRVPTNIAIGVRISSLGCPQLLSYAPRVSANVSLCLQTVLETVRLSCPNRCGLFQGR